MYNKYIGIILKKHPLGEADELLTIYTKSRGKLRVKAVASRKIKSRLAGNLQSLNEIEFETAGKASGREHGGRDGLPVLISARARTINNYLRENLKKFVYALVGIETLYRLAPDRQENQEAYQLLLDFLRTLGKSQEENFLVRRLQLNLLQVSGFSFPLGQCLNCQMSLDEGGRDRYFVPAKGGFFCSRCVKQESAEIFLGPEAFSQLSSLQTGAKPVGGLKREAERSIDGFLQYVLEREIKSSEFVETLNQETQDF